MFIFFYFAFFSYKHSCIKHWFLPLLSEIRTICDSFLDHDPLPLKTTVLAFSKQIAWLFTISHRWCKLCWACKKWGWHPFILKTHEHLDKTKSEGLYMIYDSHYLPPQAIMKRHHPHPSSRYGLQHGRLVNIK